MQLLGTLSDLFVIILASREGRAMEQPSGLCLSAVTEGALLHFVEIYLETVPMAREQLAEVRRVEWV